MPKILLKLFYNHTEVEVWCDTEWTPQSPTTMIATLVEEIHRKAPDLIRDLVERRKNEQEQRLRMDADAAVALKDVDCEHCEEDSNTAPAKSGCPVRRSGNPGMHTVRCRYDIPY